MRTLAAAAVAQRLAAERAVKLRAQTQHAILHDFQAADTILLGASRTDIELPPDFLDTDLSNRRHS